MGLDMYLYKKTYVQNWDHMKPEHKHEISVKYGGQEHKTIKPERIAYIVESVAYWRKANQIHAWFVKHCQDGIDDCREARVTAEQLKKLVSDCQAVFVEPKLASSILPTQDGFFFGGTEYDDYYKQDLEYTMKTISLLLAEGEEEYYYRSSW